MTISGLDATRQTKIGDESCGDAGISADGHLVVVVVEAVASVSNDDADDGSGGGGGGTVVLVL